MANRALALDLGTSSVRAIVFEARGPGNVTAVDGASARRPRHVDSSCPGQATFDVDDYFSDLVACIDELHAAGSLEGVGEIAADSQWHSIVAVDGTGRPQGDLVSWADTRPRRPAGAAQPSLEAMEELRQRTGCAFAPMYWTWRAPWLIARGAPGRFMSLPDYVGLVLLEDPSTSVSVASGTGLLNTTALTWDDEALELAGLAPASLPPIAPAGWRGRLTSQWRRRWPELADAKWHPVLGDGAAANVGVGCDRPGRAAMTVGTSAAVRVARPSPDRSRLPAGLCRYCIDHRRVVLGAAYSSGGQLYSWALAVWEAGPLAGVPGGVGGVPFEVRFDVPMPVGAGSEGVLVLPWHAGTRPPAPGVPASQGCVLGLGLGHTGAHIVSAAAESVCFELAGGLGDLETTDGGALAVVANGGAIDRSPWWRQRLASVLGRPVRFPAADETTARGAAAHALGVELADEEGETLLPVAADVDALAGARRRWARWYEELLPIAGSQGADGQDLPA